MTRKRFVPEKDGVPAHWVELEKGRAVLNFKELETAQLTREQAEAIGAHFDPRDGITTIRYEKQLREHLARERAAGRDVRWKEHDECKPRKRD